MDNQHRIEKDLRLPKARNSNLRPTAGRLDRVAAKSAKVNEPSSRFSSETETAHLQRLHGQFDTPTLRLVTLR
ncbi:MAG: hypothetical protein DWI22_17220 [Planctomycetota bacterium]|nr:MAG: hypothetical protein DWI22_17220 [Planctomycetota bacterium]